MSEAVALIPIRRDEILVGRVLRRSIFDHQGKLLLASGCVVESENQLAGLLENGYFHDRRGASPTFVSEAKNSSPNAIAAPVEVAPPTSKEMLIDMDEVRWNIGEPVYLQVFDNPSLRYVVRLIGFIKHATVLVTAPVVDGKYELIRVGQNFIVRTFSGKKAYAFMAPVLKSVHTPQPYLHLTYPKQLRCNVVRQGARTEVHIIVALTKDGTEQPWAGTMVDLSVDGASVVIKETLGKNGDRFQIKFMVAAAGQDEYLNLQTILRSAIPVETGSGFRHGFQFVDLSAHERLVLSAFVHQRLVEAS